MNAYIKTAAVKVFGVDKKSALRAAIATETIANIEYLYLARHTRSFLG